MFDSSINQQIQWHDLTEYSWFDTTKELCLPLTFFTLSLVAINFSFTLAAICVSYTFLFSLRVAHNSFHRALGLPVWANDWVMLVVSWILIGSAHAIYTTHIYHHDHCLESDDVEGQLAHHSFWHALLLSPIYPFQIHLKALKIASTSKRQWIASELLTSSIFHLIILPNVFGVNYFVYLTVMILANLFAPMFGIWLVHRDCDEPGLQARSCRSSAINLFTGNMFYHHEHHLFPAVPSRNMPKLGTRIDAHTKKKGLMVF